MEKKGELLFFLLTSFVQFSSSFSLLSAPVFATSLPFAHLLLVSHSNFISEAGFGLQNVNVGPNSGLTHSVFSKDIDTFYSQLNL
jgi:hypothetical protein